jgi:hypothetical protein
VASVSASKTTCWSAAVLGSRAFEDDATVLLEISAPGFVPVYVDVPLSWSVPDVFVEVPF